MTWVELDIGHGVTIAWYAPDELYWRHPKCRAWFPVFFRPHALCTGHQLAVGGPDDTRLLTITGSLLCPKGCGTHGHITLGRWEPC